MRSQTSTVGMRTSADDEQPHEERDPSHENPRRRPGPYTERHDDEAPDPNESPRRGADHVQDERVRHVRD